MSDTPIKPHFDPAQRWDYENGFFLTTDPSRMAKLCAHYELYKRVAGLAGAIVECGVFKGSSLMRWASFRRIFDADSRPIVGFDAFGAFPRTGSEAPADEQFIREFEAEAGDGFSQAEIEFYLKTKGIAGVELIAGDINLTVPAYVARKPELRIALLHIDVDVYEPSKTILNHLCERVVSGGIVVLDDYGVIEGETRAVDEYLAGRGIAVQRLAFSAIPAYFVMP